MPLFLFKKDERGQSYLEEVDSTYTGAPKEVPTPSQASLSAGTKIWICELDNLKFKTAGLAAKHFNKTYPEKREDKDSWREHTKIEAVA